MPTLGGELSSWGRTEGAVGLGAPRSIAELVQQLGGPGRAGGTRRAAEYMEVDIRTVQRYVTPVTRREARGHVVTVDGRTYRAIRDPRTERAFNRAVGRLDRERDPDVDVSVTLRGPWIKVSQTYTKRRDLTVIITARRFRLVRNALRRGDAQAARNSLEDAFLVAYGIGGYGTPDALPGAIQDQRIGEVDGIEIRPA